MPTTSWPSASRRSLRCEPMNPAAPVTTDFIEGKPAGWRPRFATRPIFSNMFRFESWLADSGIGVSVKQFPAGTRTAVDAANAIGCDVGQIVKSLVFVAAGRPVVALVSGANRLDERRLELAAGQPARNAGAQVVRAATGYAIGCVPPFGHATEVPVFMDRDLLRHAVVWAAAGRPDSVFEIDLERACELSGRVVGDLKVNS